MFHCPIQMGKQERIMVMKFKNMNKYIYRGHDIIENKNSYGVYGSNDELIRIFFKKDDVKLEDVYKHVDKMRKEENG